MRVNLRWLLSVSTLCLYCVIFTFCTAFATSSTPESNVNISEVSTEIGDNYVRYPQLEGMNDPAVQTHVNDAIVDEANIVQRLITLSTLQPGGTGLQVNYSTYEKDMLFSTVISAKGMMENLRSGHTYASLSYDLQTGKRLTLDDFFSDPGTAIAWMEEQLPLSLENDLSSYLEYAELTPLPVDAFSFDQNGITFYYPNKQFSLLSGYSGSVQFQYGELQDFLIRDDGSVPVRLGAILPEYTDAEIKEKIEATVSLGTLPWLSIHLGDPVPDLIASYSLPNTPDHFPDGRYLQFENAAFRQILILTDALTSGYEASVVEGILSTRTNLFGIQTGITSQSRWREILGDPYPTLIYDASLSADYGLPIGTADYYSIGDRQLMLYADEDGILYAVQLK